MKTLKTHIVLIMVALFMVACSKDDDNPIMNDDNNTVQKEPSLDGEIVLYSVNGNTITKTTEYEVSGADLTFQQNNAKHQELWEAVKKVIPTDYRHYLKDFLLFNAEVNGASAYVEATNDELSKWKLAISSELMENPELLLETIIHEFSHIVTLNNTQIDASIAESNCNNYYRYGCSKNESIVGKNFTNYWTDILTEYNAIQNDPDRRVAFYNNHRNRFVSEYATTNPAEDIAEVFTVFVTRDARPTGTTIADRKILDLYNNATMVELRNYIRSNNGL